MGCDINWYAVEPDKVKQRKAALFVNAVVDKMNGMVSEKPCRETDILKGFEYGYFLNLDAIDDNKIWDIKQLNLMHNIPAANKKTNEPAIHLKQTPKSLLGFTAHFDGRTVENIEQEEQIIPYFLAKWQLSMVFNNTPVSGREKKGELITFEWVDDPKWIMEDKMKMVILENPENHKVRFGAYRSGGYVRTSGQNDLFIILYLLRELFIPSLHVSDDWAYIKDLSNEMEKRGIKKALTNQSQRWDAVAEITKEYLGFEFREENIRPEVVSRWGRLE